MSEKKSSRIDGILNWLTNLSAKMAQNKVMSAITEAMSSTLSVVLVGSFALLIAALDIGPWQKIVNSIPYLVGVGYRIKNVTIDLLSVYVVGILAFQYSNKIGLKQRVVTAAAAVGVFAMLTPFTDGNLTMVWLGTQGMVTAMIVGILVPLAIKKMIDANLNIKLPAGVPTFVSDSFAILIPSFIVFACAGVLNILASLTPYGDVQNLLFMIIQTPMSKIGLSLPGFVLLSVIAGFGWWCGIHGNAIFSPMLALLMVASAANQAAPGELPNIIEYQFNQACMPGGYGNAFIIALLTCFCKSSSLKSIGRASVVPSLFTIGEPILFGFPVLFNAILLIPVLITTAFNVIYWYLVISIGLVGRFTGVILPWTTPTLLAAPLSSSTPVQAFIACLIMLLIDCAIFWPFIKALDRKNLAEETAKEETNA